MTHVDIDNRMDTLAEDATYLQPRLFAIYGVYERDTSDEILGWGMEFGDELGALFYEPYSSTTWSSGSARQILASHRLIADVRLKWLD